MPSIPRSLRAAARGLVLLAPACVLAQPASEPVFITATRLVQPLSQVLADVVLIDRAAIERAGTASLTSLLQRLGGVEIAATGGAGQPSSVFLRGTNSGHVLVLVDGVRMNSATTGNQAFEHLPLAQIERIEILRGPASGLYGADAIGGVIQIFTRRDPGFGATLELGSERTRALDLHLGRAIGTHTRLNLQAGQRQSDSRSATNENNPWSFHPDADLYRNRHLSLALAHDWSADGGLSVRGQWSQGRSAFDAGAFTDDDTNHQRLSVLAVQAHQRLTPDWTSRLRLARGGDDLRTEGAFASRFRTDQDQFLWQNDLAAGPGQLALGAEWRREAVASDTAYTLDSRRVGSLFGSYAARYGAAEAFGVQAALRHDRSSQFGGNSSGNLAWGWQATPRWRLSAAVGTAFKAPSFNDLYYPLSFGYAGNPDLKPERARSAEAALRYADGNYSAGITVFHNRIRDLIVINSSFSSVDNLARARIEGVTLNSRWQQGPWAARAEWTHQDAKDADSGARLARRARNHGTLGLDWTRGPWRLGADVVAAGERQDGGASLAGYGLVNLHAAWQLNRRVGLRARIDNAADKAYTLVSGYNTPRRGAFLALELSGD